jgi:biopolymer transport protein ExbB
MNIVFKSKVVLLAMGASPVMYLMIGLSVLSLAITLERAYFFYSIRDDLEKLARQLRAYLRGHDYEEARKMLEASPSAEAAVVIAGLGEIDHGPHAAEEAMAGAQALQRMRLERRLAYLGTLGNNAPFIGLFGTVIGIMQAFERVGEAGKSGAQAASTALAPTEVMNAISEALVATAIGLGVAIPAVVAFNYFGRLIKATVTNTDALSRVLLAHMKAEESDDEPAVRKKASASRKRESRPADKHEKAESKSAAADGEEG